MDMLIDLFYTLLIPITHGILNYFKHFDLFKFSFYTLLGRSRVTFSICLILPQYLGKKIVQVHDTMACELRSCHAG